MNEGPWHTEAKVPAWAHSGKEPEKGIEPLRMPVPELVAAGSRALAAALTWMTTSLQSRPLSSMRSMPKQPDAETSSCQVGSHHDLLAETVPLGRTDPD